MSSSPCRRSKRTAPLSVTAMSSSSVASLPSVDQTLSLALLALRRFPWNDKDPLSRALGQAQVQVSLRDAANALHDLARALLDFIRAGLDAVPSLLRAALDRTTIAPQRGLTASLETVELLAGALTVAVRADDLGEPVARLQSGTYRDQHGTLRLVTNCLEAEPLGGDPARRGEGAIPRGRLRRASGSPG